VHERMSEVPDRLPCSGQTLPANRRHVFPGGQQRSRVPRVLVPGRIPGIQPSTNETESSPVSGGTNITDTDVSREQGVAGRIVGGQSVKDERYKYAAVYVVCSVSLVVLNLCIH